MRNASLSRRAALGMLARGALMAFVGAPAAARARARGAGAAHTPEAPLRQIERILRSRESALALGAAYLRLRPQEASVELLLNRSGFGGAGGDAPWTALHRDDFRCDRVVRLGGWTLSETELRLCAVVYLSSA